MRITQEQSKLKQSFLTKEMLSSILNYDAETGVFKWKETAKNPMRGKVAGTSIGNRKQYISIGIRTTLQNGAKKPVYYLAHRLAWLYVTGNWPNEELDHIDGDGTNNSIHNLREVDRLQNMKNQKLSRLNKSGRCGVRFSSFHGKWIVKIGSGKRGNMKHIGVFDDYFDAVCARKSAENRLNYHENHGRAY